MNCLTNLLPDWNILIHLTNGWLSTSERLQLITLYDRWYISPFLSPIAVTILHKIHHSIEVLRKNKNPPDYWFSKYDRILHHYSVSTADATAATLCYRKWLHNRKWPITGSDVSHMTEVTWFSPRFFLTIVAVQNVPLHGKVEDTKRIIRSRKSNDKQHNDQKIPKE
jgi:hypothetical protein